MTRCTLRNIFTILLYGGVGIFLFPYLTGHLGHALTYLLIGIGVTVVCGILRCCCVEGDCTDVVAATREHIVAERDSAAATQPQPQSRA